MAMPRKRLEGASEAILKDAEKNECDIRNIRRLKCLHRSVGKSKEKKDNYMKIMWTIAS